MTEPWEERMVAALPHSSGLVGGSAEAFDYAIESITLAGGDSFTLLKPGVTAIVGANNAGKSTVLRELHEALSRQPGMAAAPPISVAGYAQSRAGTNSDVVAWLAENSRFVIQPGNAGFQRFQTDVSQPNQLVSTWHDPTHGIGLLAKFVTFYGNAQARFSIGGSAEMRDSISDPPIHPLHYLQDSRDLFDEIDRIARKVFGRPLTLDTLARTIRLRVGTLDLKPPPVDNVSAQYRDALSTLRPLDEQGDGMRSLMGQLLPIAGAPYRIVIIDEPEAFLHPPQAHALGEELGKLSRVAGIQVLVATHDRNFLTGLLDSQVKVSVVRLTRGDGAASAAQLDSASLFALWNDPVLKYTNVLDGLFHRVVVLAEAEADCAYLAASIDGLPVDEVTLPRSEVLFVPTGGKDGMPKVASALAALKVPVVAAPDLDVISDQVKLKDLVEAMGATWTEEMAALWNSATADMRAPQEQAKVGHVLDALNSALEPTRDLPFSADHRETALAQLRTTGSPWSRVKEFGVAAFKGQARQSLESLLNSLEAVGIVLVREGELERLAPEVSARKGSGWLQAALTSAAQLNAPSQGHARRIVTAMQERV